MKHWRWWLAGAALALGGVILPIAAYVTAGRFVGSYAGTRGLASYLGTLYAEAGAGRPLALLLILGPLACVGAWLLRAWTLRRLAAPEVPPG
jgi:hypothetical protein